MFCMCNGFFGSWTIGILDSLVLSDLFGQIVESKWVLGNNVSMRFLEAHASLAEPL